jgi:hypothetical protein
MEWYCCTSLVVEFEVFAMRLSYLSETELLERFSKKVNHRCDTLPENLRARLLNNKPQIVLPTAVPFADMRAPMAIERCVSSANVHELPLLSMSVMDFSSL